MFYKPPASRQAICERDGYLVIWSDVEIKLGTVLCAYRGGSKDPKKVYLDEVTSRNVNKSMWVVERASNEREFEAQGNSAGFGDKKYFYYRLVSGVAN